MKRDGWIAASRAVAVRRNVLMPCEPALCANEGCFCAELAQLCLDVVALLHWLGRGAHDSRVVVGRVDLAVGPLGRSWGLAAPVAI